MGVQTRNQPAEDGAYTYAFQEYINMLSSWSFLQNISLVQFPPDSMDDAIGNIDPNYELWTCLVPRISQYFDHDLTQIQLNEASASLRKLRNRSSKDTKMKPYRNAPRGSGNRYYRYCQHDSECCHD